MTRIERVESLIQEEVSTIMRNKVSDPRVGFISVTKVKVTPDYKNASIYVSIFADENKKNEAMQGLYSATGFIQRELGNLLEMRTTPKIQFVRDDSLEEGSRVINLINRLENEKSTGRNKKSRKKG